MITSKTSCATARPVRTRISGFVLAATGAVLFLTIWTAASFMLGETRLPLVTTVIVRFFQTVGSSPEVALQGGGEDGFFPHVLATALHYLVGTLGGLVLASAGLMVAARFASVRATMHPLVSILRAIPPLALAPFILLWFGTAPAGQALLVAFYTFVMIYPPGVAAIERTDPVLVQFASTLGASKSTIAREILLPSVVPALTGPLQVAFSWSWGLVVVSEILGAQAGLGKLLVGFVPITATDLIMASIIWILLLAIFSELILSLALRRSTRWVA